MLSHESFITKACSAVFGKGCASVVGLSMLLGNRGAQQGNEADDLGVGSKRA